MPTYARFDCLFLRLKAGLRCDEANGALSVEFITDNMKPHAAVAKFHRWKPQHIDDCEEAVIRRMP